MKIEAELKPLIANLKRIKIGEYLNTKEFELFALERNLDEIWKSAKKEISQNKRVVVIGYHNTEEEEDAFAILINYLYLNDFDYFGHFVTTVLLVYVDWSKTKIDINGTYEALKKLDVFRKKELLNFIEQARSIRDTKPTKIEEPAKQVKKESTDPKKVFIVHGHDDKARLEVCHLLKSEFKLETIVLQEQPNESLDTIIAKFERLASDCGMAIVLMTADDVSNKFTRTRQNVIFELGYFLGKLRGKEERRIIIIKNGDVEIPSDISGVLYLEFHKSVEELYLPIKKQLMHWKIIKSI
ncbi:nucleotide-binding protein [Ekhidna sp.]|jgi:predicted nucleotide-binding protein|uniref:nucleotide-binding protein n=1 Tax=Ekhidna sp. TaxID=2608089 RepID=UPI0032EB17E3